MSENEVDADVAAMKRANRKPLYITAGVIVAIAVWLGLQVLSGASAVRKSLEADGYTDIDVKTNGLFDFGYTAKKGNSTCGGSVTRLPFSTSKSEVCMSH
jgi:hypothetical protein